MSERTCQLCGKPLSRIRVGGGEEFCSREHRTQYRLRRGMDRLQEANKVASLMRRRENPKPIAVSPVAETVWRGYFQALPNASQTLRLPRRASLARVVPGLPAASYVLPNPAGSVKRSPRKLLEPPFEPGLAQNLALRSVRTAAACAVAQAPAVLPPAAGPARNQARKSETLAGKPVAARVLPPRLTTGPARSRGTEPAAFMAVPVDAREGMLLRVSRAVGFRVPARTLPPLADPKRVPLSMRWPDLLTAAAPAAAASSRSEAEIMQVPVATQATGIGCNWRPDPQPYPGARPPDVHQLVLAAHDLKATWRSAGVEWPLNDDPVLKPARDRELGSVHMSEASRLLPLNSMRPAPVPAKRVPVVPFGSGDITFGYSEEEHPIQ